MIRKTFLPCILLRKTKNLSPVVGDLSTMPVKKYGMGLLNPVTSDQEKYSSSAQGSAELVQAVTGGGEFSHVNHLRTLSDERQDGKEAWDVAYEYRLKGLVINIQGTDKSIILRTISTGKWLSVRGTK